MAIELGLGLEITELRLGLPGACGGSRSSILREKNEKKRAYSEIVSDGDSSNGGDQQRKSARTTTKIEGGGVVVVGWPPVCSYRKKTNSLNGRDGSKMYVKVSMDGAPFLRKIDLSSQNGYPNLVMALEKLFGCFGIAEAMKDADNSEYVPIYEDKDGDWMLVGDVPWEMFSESCKRLRIMKRSDAKVIGLHTKCFLLGTTKDE